MLKAAADESPRVVSARAIAAVAEAGEILGVGCEGMLRCFQLRAQAVLDAAQDAESLGYTSSLSLTESYASEIASWRSILPTEAELDRAVEEAERAAPKAVLSVLPKLRTEQPANAADKSLHLTLENNKGWTADLRLICRVQLINDLALVYRDEYIELLAGEVPCASRFSREIEIHLRRLYAEHVGSTQHSDMQRQSAHAIVGIDGLLKSMDAPDVLNRVAELRTHLVSLLELLRECDHGTQHETWMHLEISKLAAVLSGVLNGDRSVWLKSPEHYRKVLVAVHGVLRDSPHRIHVERLEQAIGSGAAVASRWRIRALERRLSEADYLLRPLGSYLSRWRAPKQLQVRYALDRGLRDRLGAEYPEFARSKVIAAAFKVYADSALGPPGGINQAALNSIEKLRGRVDEVDARNQMNELRGWCEWP